MQEFILTIVAFYVLFRVFGRNVKVYHYNNFYSFKPKEKPRKDGTITVDRVPKKTGSSKPDKNNDEYVDFEEIR